MGSERIVPVKAAKGIFKDGTGTIKDCVPEKGHNKHNKKRKYEKQTNFVPVQEKRYHYKIKQIENNHQVQEGDNVSNDLGQRGRAI